MYSVVLNAMKVKLVTGALSFDGIQTEVTGWASTFVVIGLVYWLTKSFFGKSFGQMVISGLAGGLTYYVVKNPETVMNSVSGIFKSIFG